MIYGQYTTAKVCIQSLHFTPCVRTVLSIDIMAIINWVVSALNSDWLKAMVYQTVYHVYDKTLIVLI